MNKTLGKVYGPLVVLVDLALLIDIATDLIDKWKNRKAKKNNSKVIEKEDPNAETV